jgi:splicing suppressor protein 51
MAPVRKCTTCHKIDDCPFNVCGSCKTTVYCSCDCLVRDFKNHRKVCSELADIYLKKNPPGTPEFNSHRRVELPVGWPQQAMPARLPPHNAHLNVDTTKLTNSTFFSGHDKTTTYKLLIECGRCWDETKRVGMVKMQGDLISDGVHYAEDFSFKNLHRFIIKAERKGNLLPSWWNALKRIECEEVGKELYHWSDITTKGGQRIQ